MRQHPKAGENLQQTQQLSRNWSLPVLFYFTILSPKADSLPLNHHISAVQTLVPQMFGFLIKGIKNEQRDCFCHALLTQNRLYIYKYKFKIRSEDETKN